MISRIPLEEVRRDFQTDEARLLRAGHVRLRVRFLDRAGKRVERLARIDTGAPFSVLPCSVWQAHGVWWQPLGTDLLTLTGQPESDAAKWLGVPCSFGEARVALIDDAGRHTRLLRFVAKFPHAPVPSHMERVILLGYNFLADNSLTLTLHPQKRVIAGTIPNVAGWLTLP